MKRVNALQVRQALGRILDQLDRDNEPLLLEKERQPRAVLVPLRLFRERFADRTVHEERIAIGKRIEELGRTVKLRRGPKTTELIRELRGPLP